MQMYLQLSGPESATGRGVRSDVGRSSCCRAVLVAAPHRHERHCLHLLRRGVCIWRESEEGKHGRFGDRITSTDPEREVTSGSRFEGQIVNRKATQKKRGPYERAAPHLCGMLEAVLVLGTVCARVVVGLPDLLRRALRGRSLGEADL